MSQTEYHTGKVKFLGKVKTKEDLSKYIDVSNFKENQDLHDFLSDNYWEKYIIVDDFLFKIDDTEYEDFICKATKTKVDEIEYVATFHNGGTYLMQIIEGFILKHLMP